MRAVDRRKKCRLQRRCPSGECCVFQGTFGVSQISTMQASMVLALLRAVFGFPGDSEVKRKMDSFRYCSSRNSTLASSDANDFLKQGWWQECGGGMESRFQSKPD